MSSLTMNFEAIPGLSFIKIAIGSPEIIWGITEGHTIVRYAPDEGHKSPWEKMPSLDANHRAVGLDCAEDGTVLIVGQQVNSTKTKVYRFVESANDYQEIEALEFSHDISVGSATQIYACLGGSISRYWGENQTEIWAKAKIPYSLPINQVAAAADGTVLASRYTGDHLYAYPKQLLETMLTNELSKGEKNFPPFTAASAADIYFVDKFNLLNKYLCELNTVTLTINERVHKSDKKGDFVYFLQPLEGQILDINACNSKRMVMIVKKGSTNTAYISLPDTDPYAPTENKELNVKTKKAKK